MDLESAEGQSLEHKGRDKGVVSHHGSLSSDKNMLDHPSIEEMVKQEKNPNNNATQHGNEQLESGNQDAAMFREMTLRQEMELEKQRYPGASSWASDEERLFEMLFQRQEISILPHHWALDFASSPMPENVFDKPDEKKAIVYAFREPDFPVTSAIQQLISLTGDAMAVCECGQDAKAPKLIEKRINKFLKVVAQDAGYDDLKFIPNIFVEPVDVLKEGLIADYMTERMKSLAWLQRQFLREDRPLTFWEDIAPTLLSPKATKRRFSNQHLQAKKRKVDDILENSEACQELGDSSKGEDHEHLNKRLRPEEEPPLAPKEDQKDEVMLDTAAEASVKPSTPAGRTQALKAKDDSRPRRSPSSGISPRTKIEPKTPSPPRTIPLSVQYHHQPPVIYGLFIVNTDVFLLTIDSSREHDPKITYHLNMDFVDSKHSVWNALTIAIVACLAREHIRGVRHSFDSIMVESESDPDA